MVPRREPFLVTPGLTPCGPSVARRVVLWVVAVATVVGFALAGSPVRQGSLAAERETTAFPVGSAASTSPRADQPAALPRSGTPVVLATVPLGPAPALAPEVRSSALITGATTGADDSSTDHGRLPDGVPTARAPPMAPVVVPLSLSPSAGWA